MLLIEVFQQFSRSFPLLRNLSRTMFGFVQCHHTGLIAPSSSGISRASGPRYQDVRFPVLHARSSKLSLFVDLMHTSATATTSMDALKQRLSGMSTLVFEVRQDAEIIQEDIDVGVGNSKLRRKLFLLDQNTRRLNQETSRARGRSGGIGLPSKATTEQEPPTRELLPRPSHVLSSDEPQRPDEP